MKTTILFIVFNLLFQSLIFSQENNSKEKINDNNKIEGSLSIKAVVAQQKNNPSESIDSNTTKIDSQTILDFNKKNESKIPKQYVLDQQPKDKAIFKKKYWMGNDVTNAKLKSNLSLGAVTSKTNRIKIEFRDFGSIDGDRIRVFLNEKEIESNVVLEGNYYFVYLNLEPGFNRIDFQALNEGLVGPNTVELNVMDDNGVEISSNNWSLSTDEIATLVVTKN